MAKTTILARTILSCCNGNLVTAVCETTRRYKKGMITEAEAMRIYDVLVALCSR